METQYYSILVDETKPIGERYQSIFYLKSINTEESIKMLMEAYEHIKSSVLLAH